jgi:hypothetical protein
MWATSFSDLAKKAQEASEKASSSMNSMNVSIHMAFENISYSIFMCKLNQSMNASIYVDSCTLL